MAANPKKQLSLDTNILLALADGTFDKRFLDINEDELRLATDEAELPHVSIAHPGRRLRAIR